MCGPRTEEVGHGGVGIAPYLGRGDRVREKASEVAACLHQGACDGIDDALGNLGSGRVIEVDRPLPLDFGVESRELPSNVIDRKMLHGGFPSFFSPSRSCNTRPVTTS